MEVNFNTFPTIITKEDHPQDDGARTPIVNLPTSPSQPHLIETSAGSPELATDDNMNIDMPPNVSTTEEAQDSEEEAEGGVPIPIVNLPTYREPSNHIDPSASLQTLVDNTIQEVDGHFSPMHHAPSASSRLSTLIQADRHPPGQRAMFAAIDALRPELELDDVMDGAKVALNLLRETLQEALNDPSQIQRKVHVRNKLLREYLALPEEVRLWDIAMDAMVKQMKEWVGQRWAVEAMESQVEFVQL